MTYRQRDIVEVNFLFPDGTFKPHPAIVVSNNKLQENEGFLYLVLVSSKDTHREYSCGLDDDMLSKPMYKKSFVKCHIISGYTENDIKENIICEENLF